MAKKKIPTARGFRARDALNFPGVRSIPAVKAMKRRELAMFEKMYGKTKAK